MTCQRCEGLMVTSKLWDESISVDVKAHYCLNCGEIIDRVILLNRRTMVSQVSQRVLIR